MSTIKSFIVIRPLVIVVLINTAEYYLVRLPSVCAVLILLLTVEGTGVITPARRRVIQTGEAVTLAGLRSESLVSQRDP